MCQPVSNPWKTPAIAACLASVVLACAARAPEPAPTRREPAPGAMLTAAPDLPPVEPPTYLLPDPARRDKLTSAFAAIDAALSKRAQESRVPGYAFGLVIDGELAHVFTHGVADRTTGAAVDAETRFRVGSVTKTFTALAPAKLRDDGRVSSFDEPLERFVPEARALRYPTQDAGPVRIRDMLLHSSGLIRNGDYDELYRSAMTPAEMFGPCRGLPDASAVHARPRRWPRLAREHADEHLRGPRGRARGARRHGRAGAPRARSLTRAATSSGELGRGLQRLRAGSIRACLCCILSSSNEWKYTPTDEQLTVADSTLRDLLRGATALDRSAAPELRKVETDAQKSLRSLGGCVRDQSLPATSADEVALRVRCKGDQVRVLRLAFADEAPPRLTRLALEQEPAPRPACKSW